jgi:hypothetical protein
MGMEEGGIMAKLVFTQDDISKRYFAKSKNGVKYGVGVGHYIHGNNLMRFRGVNLDYSWNDLKLKTWRDIAALAQFIEDNYKTLTLEQLDNIEEVYQQYKDGLNAYSAFKAGEEQHKNEELYLKSKEKK